MSVRRVFVPGDNEPPDLPRLVDAWGDTWFVSRDQRTDGTRWDDDGEIQ